MSTAQTEAERSFDRDAWLTQENRALRKRVQALEDNREKLECVLAFVSSVGAGGDIEVSCALLAVAESVADQVLAERRALEARLAERRLRRFEPRPELSEAEFLALLGTPGA